MKYRVLYRKYSEIASTRAGAPAFSMVEDDIEADDIEIGDTGTLMLMKFENGVTGTPLHRRPILVLPPTFWFNVEPTPPTKSNLIEG